MTALKPGVQRHHAKNDRADEDVVGEAGDPDQHDAVAHHPQDEDAKDGADYGSPPPVRAVPPMTTMAITSSS